MADFENLVRLAQSFPELDSPGGTICEPEDRPLDSRHLDMVFALQTLSDKPYMGSVTSGPNAADTIRMGEILFGGREAIERDAGVDLADQRQQPAALRRPHARRDVRVREGQPGGGDHPVPADGRDVAGVAAGHAGAADGRGAGRDRARAADPPGRAGRCSARFLSNTDMQSGSPSFGTPESGIGVLCTGQIARRFGLPWRGGGALNASQTVDAQAAYESLMTLPADVPGRRQLRHALGGLARGRPGLLLREVHRRHRAAARAARTSSRRWRSTRPRWPSTPTSRSAPAGTSSAPPTRSSASASASTGRCCPRPRTSTAGPRRARATRPRGPARSGARRSRSYEQPPIDDAIDAELREFVVRRRAELGD